MKAVRRVAFAIFLVGCATRQPAQTPILFEVQPPELTLCEQEETLVRVRVAWLGDESEPDGPPHVAWRSGNERVVTVDDTGLIRAGESGLAQLVGQVAWGRFEVEREVPVTVKVGRLPQARVGRMPGVAQVGAKSCGPSASNVT